jgi:hypothetical protein
MFVEAKNQNKPTIVFKKYANNLTEKSKKGAIL